METQTVDIQKLLSDYVDDLNVAVESRQFPPFVQKWFAVPNCMLSFKHETQGIENAKTLWTHLLPIGVEGAPREVLQFPYKVENGRVYAWRQLQGGNSPKPLYGLQETQFDDRTLISEISIMSVQDKPEVDEEPGGSDVQARSNLRRVRGRVQRLLPDRRHGHHRRVVLAGHRHEAGQHLLGDGRDRPSQPDRANGAVHALRLGDRGRPHQGAGRLHRLGRALGGNAVGHGADAGGEDSRAEDRAGDG